MIFFTRFDPKFRLKFPFRRTLYIKTAYFQAVNSQILGSIVVSIPACHAGDPGSIPGRGGLFELRYLFTKSTEGSNGVM